ncbi:YjgN family protein [Chitinophagaceae bacterium LB-8]|uniref:YjgN family protein n=1 Tax=Paraflavisolibacter caeni TaxID=2982496 RepID=A0A9X2XRY9_9BACT|nr:DUF898 family protein [Paraflavisolibacter caeni]MCU7547691.1 YjgN family protein [Paraflavisolibacter caeni]
MKEYRSYPIAFYGKGSEYFKIQIVNTILNILTLGLYYPWAKERSLKYLYSKNTFDETPFVFSGTGKEMFKGFIKAIVILVLLYGIFTYFAMHDHLGIAALIIYGGILAITPLAIHGSYKYRMAKTSWKGIRFGYTGNRKELIILFFKGIFFTLITFGIYGAWFTIHLRRYVLSNIKVGNARFVYTGDGSDYFGLNLKGYFLSVLTLGIYSFWWQKELFEYFINNLRLEQDEDAVFFRSMATAGGFAGLLIVNALILVFTLGLGYAWVVTRTMEFVMNNIEASGYYSFESLQQAQEDYSDATADDMADILDFGFVI